MRKIAGRTVLEGAGIGIPDLLVVLHDVDHANASGDSIALAVTDDQNERPSGARLGSVLTDANGAFELVYEDGDMAAQIAAERRDLLLSVLAPEGPDQDPNARVLFVSPRRPEAGCTEHWIIRLPGAQLEAAKVPLPTTPSDEVVEDSDRVVARLLMADKRREAVDEGMQAVDRKKVERVRTTADDFRTRLEPDLRRALSRVPDSLVDPDSFVAPGESVADKSRAIIQRDIQRVVNSTDPRVRAPVRGVVMLTAEQRDAVANQLGEDGTISSEALEEITGKAGGRPATFVVRGDPVAEMCRQRTAEETDCLLPLLDDDGNGGEDNDDERPEPEDLDRDVTGRGVEAITEQDIRKLIARVADTMTSPEEGVLFGLETRADRSTVGEDLRTLSFAPSPADTPAFYDFHNLQIAFEHVWQEAVDEGVLDLAEDAYEDIVELGGDPLLNGDGRQKDPFHTLLSEARLVLTARREVRDHRGRSVSRDHREGVTVRDQRGETTVRDQRGDVNVHVRDHHGERPGQRLPELLRELERRLREEYAFTIYAANRKERSVNFGLLVTYRQRWEPLAYQAGKLLKTITLAPKETQRYSRKTVVRRKRAEKEVEHHSQTRREEAADTSRAEQEIVRKAMAKTNFSLVTEGSVNVEIAQGTSTSTFGREAVKSSDDIKKAFHEAVFKSAQEYKNEHTTEVNTEDVEELEVTESGEISNPNDELAVTFLFYELQRRYRVSERIHRAIPVVLVAQEVPRPDEIDEAWILSYDWILRRSLLDDSFIPALNHLGEGVIGEEVALEELRRNVEQQRRIVDELRRELVAVRERESFQRGILERALFQQARVVPRRPGGSGGGGSIIPVFGEAIDVAADVISDVGERVSGAVLEGASAVADMLFGSDGDAAQSRQEAMAQLLQRTADEARDLLFRLEREVTALNAITEKYTQSLAKHFNHKGQIARLRIHLKSNILWYMHAIWANEPPDQRFFRLHQVPVPVLKANASTYRFASLDPQRGSLASLAHRSIGLHGRPSGDLYEYEVTTEVDPNFATAPLVQLADLDNLLGFKGNYMVFPLRESNALTDYMLDPYVIAGFDELTDPDDIANMTIEEFARYVCCLREHLTDEQFEAARGQLVEQYRRLLAAPRPSAEILTVPTNSLFIEALPANHSLIEQYKAIHRAVDVKKVQAEVREAELENIRLAARLLAGEREDPDVERKIVIEGGEPGIVVPGDSN
ncbi:hypothetical protein [Streptosporangium roseum]|uniref:hypothetical protein n=1 Tax=Streptosporangium roseum TaxID=2001 RepID=UPI00331977EC